MTQSSTDGERGPEAIGGRPKSPDKTCLVGKAVLLPAQRLVAEVMETAEGGPHFVTRVAAIGPRGAKMAAETAQSLGVGLVGAWAGRREETAAEDNSALSS